MGAFYLESILLISSISGFSFFAIEHIRKPGIHGKISPEVFQGTKTAYVISSTFLGFFCVKCTSLKVLLKVINDHLLLNIESGFSCFKAKMVLG